MKLHIVSAPTLSASHLDLLREEIEKRLDGTDTSPIVTNYDIQWQTLDLETGDQIKIEGHPDTPLIVPTK